MARPNRPSDSQWWPSVRYRDAACRRVAGLRTVLIRTIYPDVTPPWVASAEEALYDWLAQREFRYLAAFPVPLPRHERSRKAAARAAARTFAAVIESVSRAAPWRPWGPRRPGPDVSEGFIQDKAIRAIGLQRWFEGTEDDAIYLAYWCRSVRYSLQEE